VDAPDAAAARARAEELCQRLLANPVLEDAEVRLGSADEGGPGLAAGGRGR
jgi:phosphoribosylformylglycinamidine (FGAM) synthase PurS component